MDYIGLGFAYVFLGVAIGTAVVIFILDCTNKLFEKHYKNFSFSFKIWYIICVCIALATLLLVAVASEQMGFIYINAGKISEQQNQMILINTTCTDSKNCTADVPNNLEISCPAVQTCAPQNQTPCPPEIECKCPAQISYPMLSIPKI
jgi:beta-lactamase regulating signal transducer with metallopeptidase domain